MARPCSEAAIRGNIGVYRAPRKKLRRKPSRDQPSGLRLVGHDQMDATDLDVLDLEPACRQVFVVERDQKQLYPGRRRNPRPDHLDHAHKSILVVVEAQLTMPHQGKTTPEPILLLPA